MATQYGELPVALADGIVLPGSPLRRRLLISNPGPNQIWVSFGRAAVVNRSILLPPNAQPIIISNDDYPGLLQSDLHAITITGAGFLAGLSSLDVFTG